MEVFHCKSRAIIKPPDNNILKFALKYHNLLKTVDLVNLSNVTGVSIKILENLLSFINEIEIIEDEKLSDKLKRSRKGEKVPFFINNAQNYFISIDPIIFSSGFIQNSIDLDKNEISHISSEIIKAIKAINLYLIDDSNLKNNNNLDDLIRLDISHGLFIVGKKAVDVHWDENDQGFSLFINGKKRDSIFIKTRRSQKFFDDFLELMNNRKKLAGYIEEDIIQSEFTGLESFKNHLKVDLNEKNAKISIMTGFLEDISSMEHFSDIYHFFRENHHQRRTFDIQNGWKYTTPVEIEIEDMEIYSKIQFFFELSQISLQEINHMISLCNEDLVNELNQRWRNISKNSNWDINTLENYLRSLTRKEKNSPFYILLAKCLQNRIFS